MRSLPTHGSGISTRNLIAIRRQVFRGFFSDALASGGALLAIDSHSGAVIGSSRFNAYDEAAREIEIGWTFLARSHWGGHYNREMKRLMLTHAARFVDKVLFVVGSHNLRSQRAVEKLGGVQSGSRHHGDGKEDVIYTLELAQLLRHCAGKACATRLSSPANCERANSPYNDLYCARPGRGVHG